MALTRNALISFVINARALEADKRDHTAQINIDLLKLCKRIQRTLGKQSVVGVIINHLGTHFGKDLIEELCGVSFEKGKLGCACYDGTKIEYTFTDRLDASVHGTGDVFSSSFAGALLRGKSVLEAATIAQDYVVESMKQTLGDKSHWYGVKFEKAIPFLIEKLK